MESKELLYFVIEPKLQGRQDPVCLLCVTSVTRREHVRDCVRVIQSPHFRVTEVTEDAITASAISQSYVCRTSLTRSLTLKEPVATYVTAEKLVKVDQTRLTVFLLEFAQRIDAVTKHVQDLSRILQTVSEMHREAVQSMDTVYCKLLTSLQESAGTATQKPASAATQDSDVSTFDPLAI